MQNAAKNNSLSPVSLAAMRVVLLLVVALCLGQTRVWGFGVTPHPASGVFESVTPSSIGENYDGCPYDASDSLLAAKALPVPKVTDPKLGNLVNDLYKGAKGPNPIGTGSTADAVRNELAIGMATHGKFHSQKAQEYINALSNWQKKNPNASHYDQMVAESLKPDLQSALGGN